MRRRRKFKKRNRKSKIGKCDYHLCDVKKSRVFLCKYGCGRYFCKKHLSAKRPLTFKHVLKDVKTRAEQINLEREWHRIGHPCYNYGRFIKQRKKKEFEKYWDSLDRLKKIPLRKPPPVSTGDQELWRQPYKKIRLKRFFGKFFRSIKSLIVYFIIFYSISSYLIFIGVSLDLKRSVPNLSPIISKVEQISFLPLRDESEIEQIVFRLTNEERLRVGVRSLSYNEELSVLAKEHSEDMQKRLYFSHDTPEGLSPTDRAIKKGIGVTKDFGIYQQVGIGENIADTPITAIPLLIIAEECLIVLTNHQIAQCSFDVWKKSSDHYSNMINSQYTEIGVGVYCNFLGCKLTQDFR